MKDSIKVIKRAIKEKSIKLILKILYNLLVSVRNIKAREVSELASDNYVTLYGTLQRVFFEMITLFSDLCGHYVIARRHYESLSNGSKTFLKAVCQQTIVYHSMCVLNQMLTCFVLLCSVFLFLYIQCFIVCYFRRNRVSFSLFDQSIFVGNRA